MLEAGNTLAELSVKIKADTAGLKTSLNKSTQMFKQHSKAIGMAAAAMGTAIVAAGALAVRTYAQMGDEVQKMALRTGFSTEALSELRHAAEISGASLTTLEKGVKRMSGTILDAADGMETYIRAFEHIGLNVQDLMGLNPEEQFFAIATAIGELEDETVKAAIAQDMFGRAGTELLPLFAEGADGIAALRQEAHDLGIVFDQEAADKAAALTDAMTRLKESFSGIQMAIANNLIPTLMPMIDKVKEIITNISEWMKQNPELAKTITITTLAMGALLIPVGLLLVIMPGVTAAVAAFGVTLSAAIWPITLVVAAIAGLIAIGVLLWQNWDKIVVFFGGKVKTALEELAENVREAYEDIIVDVETATQRAIRSAEQVATAEKRALDDRASYYRDFQYERLEQIDELMLAEIAAANPAVAAVIEGFNEEMAGLDERERERQKADDKAYRRSLKDQLRAEDLTRAERKRLERELEEFDDTKRKEQIIEERNQEIKELNMEEYFEGQKSLIDQQLDTQITAYNADLEAFKKLNLDKLEDTQNFVNEYNHLMRGLGEETAQKFEVPTEGTLYPPTKEEAKGYKLATNLFGYASGGLITEPTLLYGLRSKQPYAIAGEAGTEVVSPTGAGATTVNNYFQGTWTIREEADIPRIARELHRLQLLRGTAG